ncbi:MAG: carbamate kinase [Patescibacteria group bacterium]|nr:carbamate kinase [Patescibacteria group bacterium]
MSTIVIALGGNAIKSAKEEGTNQQQFNNVNQTTKHLAKLIEQGHNLIITHGNGPQVGNLLLQHDIAKQKVPALPMDVCGAQSQGQIGYMMQQTLDNHLKALNIKRIVVTIVTQVEVDPKDQAFKNPTKPVGPFYTQEQAKKIQVNNPEYVIKQDAGRGYRRLVPSPLPINNLEIEAVKTLIKACHIVVCSGGGGVPVIKKNQGYHGVEAVIDKDHAGELLAELVKADIFIILTDVEKVSLHYNQPNQTNLDSITVTEAEKYLKQGHFATGSMKPKVTAAINFIKSGGKQAIITHPFKVLEALDKKTGTIITK